MKVAVAAEVEAGEPRVAATPETIKKIITLGTDVAIEPGAGIKSGIPDTEYSAAGATVAADAVSGADIVLKVRRPQTAEVARYKRGAIVIGIMDPYGHDDALRAIADAGLIAFAMELLPRITRAQAMDVLSSQANLAGLRAFHVAAALDREIDDHRAGPHRGHHFARDQARRRAAGDERRGDDDVLLLDVVADERRLLRLVLLGHFLGVAAGGFRRLELFVLDRDEFGAEAFHLLLRRGPHIGRGDDRT